MGKGIDATESVNLIIKKLLANYGQSLNELISIFSSRNYEIRLAGETARDIIMNKYPKKLQLATSASSHQMRRLFTRRKIPIYVNEHGANITLLYRTYRIATIHPDFENSPEPKCAGTIKAYWMLFAYQRIFTIDSTFIDFNGRIYDYFNACDDIVNRNVQLMAKDGVALVESDYFSIFKYFKLFGSLTRSGSGYDCKTIKSISANMNGLASINGELIWSEFKTILMQPNRYECVELFLECGGGAILGLPENPDLFEFGEIAKHSNFADHPLLGISYMCAFLETQDDVMRLHARLRLSAYERDLAIFIVKYKAATRNTDDLIHYRQMCLLPTGKNKQICREYVLELLKYHNKKILFENLLLMPLPSCIVDSDVLQWQKRRLRTIKIETTNAIDKLSCEHDANADTVKKRFSIVKEWNATGDASPTTRKKQRRQ